MLCVVFFFKQKTAYEMRISDWSSDVCSSDLSRVITIAFTSPDPALAARIANTYTSEFIKSNLQRKFNSTSYARDFLSQQLGEAKAKLEQSERDLNTYAREVGLIKTEQTNPDGSTSPGVGSVTTASLVPLNQATNEATAHRERRKGGGEGKGWSGRVDFGWG